MIPALRKKIESTLVGLKTLLQSDLDEDTTFAVEEVKAADIHLAYPI